MEHYKNRLYELLNEIENDTGQSHKLILINKDNGKELIVNNEAIEVTNSTATMNGVYKSLHELTLKAMSLNIDISYSNNKLYMEDNDGYEHEYGNYYYI